jgi:formate dehydrogenase maturation protein FdhE
MSIKSNHVKRSIDNSNVVICNVCSQPSDSAIIGILKDKDTYHRFAFCGKCINYMKIKSDEKNKIPTIIDVDTEQWATATDES